MFTELTVTPEVAEEYGELPNWISITGVNDQTEYSKLLTNLGKGEVSSISLALEIDKSLLIIDEKKGRRVAEELNIEIIGSLGILAKAKEMGIVSSVNKILRLIAKTDFRISQKIKKKILSMAGE